MGLGFPLPLSYLKCLVVQTWLTSEIEQLILYRMWTLILGSYADKATRFIKVQDVVYCFPHRERSFRLITMTSGVLRAVTAAVHTH